MSSKRYTEEFKAEAIKQVTDRGHAAAEVAARLGVSAWSLHRWIKDRQVPQAERIEAQQQSVQLRQLRADLKRVTEERDILKKAAAYFARQSG